MDLGLKLLLLVRQQVDLHVGVRGAPHVHGRQLCSLDDPHYELKEEGQGLKSEMKHLNGVGTTGRRLHIRRTYKRHCRLFLVDCSTSASRNKSD